MDGQLEEVRKRHLTEWAHYLLGAAQSGGITNGRPVAVTRVQTIAGPRAGVLELSAGLDTGKLKRALEADDCALARQFVPWSFVGDPAVFMSTRYLRIEAAWPAELAEREIRLADLGQHPKEGGRWLAGRNELGQVVTLGVSDNTPNWLLAGQTGSGKSVGLQAAGLQLARDPRTRLILLDGKWGQGLEPLSRLPGLVGPLVTDLDDALGALAWAVSDMQRRYEHRSDPSRLVILWDEPQEWLAESQALVTMTRKLLSQGRAAKVGMLMATHHPTVSCFQDPVISRSLVGRWALRVADADASRVAVGRSDPRADRLMGAGDAYWIAPNAVHRGQGVLVDDRDFSEMDRGEPLLEEWPEFCPEDLGTEPGEFSGTEIAVSILAAHEGKGRPTLRRMVDEATGHKPGGPRSQRLQRKGREAYEWLEEKNWTLCRTD